MRYIITIFIIIILTNCSHNSKTIGVKCIQNMSKCYENTDFFEKRDCFQFSKSIVNNINIEIQLWIFGEKMAPDYKELLVFINHDNSYMIPMLSNDFKSFWGFKYDIKEIAQPYINTTFKNEYLKMLQELNLSDSTKIVKELFFDTFLTLLNNRIIRDSDSADLLLKIDSRNNYYSKTDTFNRNLENQLFKDIYFNMHKYEFSKGVIYMNAIWDIYNGRVYQIDSDSILDSKSFCDSLKIYRTGTRQILMKI